MSDSPQAFAIKMDSKIPRSTKAFHKILDHLFIIRPVLMPPVWTILLLGAYHVQQEAGLSYSRTAVLLGLGIFTLLVSGIYILNQCYDVESDHQNNKLFLIASGIVQRPVALAMGYSCFGLSLIFSFYFPPAFRIICFLSVLLGLLYNVPPFLWKDKPWLGLFGNILGHGYLAFGAGWFLGNGGVEKFFIYGTPYALAIGCIYLLTTIPDLEGDRSSNKKTLPVVKGKMFTLKVILVLSVGILGCAVWINHNAAILITACVAFALFAYTYKNPEDKYIFLSIKVPILLLTIFACYYFPWYLILNLGVLVITRYYYKTRFNINYPTFY